jgi:hypothetical protein
VCIGFAVTPRSGYHATSLVVVVVIRSTSPPVFLIGFSVSDTENYNLREPLGLICQSAVDDIACGLVSSPELIPCVCHSFSRLTRPHFARFQKLPGKQYPHWTKEV